MSLQAFELVTDQSKTRLALEGTLTAWSDDVAMRLNEHAILFRSGVLHQVQGRGPRHFAAKCILREPDADTRRMAIEDRLAAEPFCTLIHPRLGRLRVVYASSKVQEDLDQVVNALTLDLDLVETGLRQDAATTAGGSARQAAQASAALVTASAGYPALAPLGLGVDSAVTAYLGVAELITTSQYDAALALNAVAGAVDTFVSAAGIDVLRYRLVAQARLAYGSCLSAYQLAGAQLPPIIRRRVPSGMSLPRFCQSLYGGGAQAIEAEIMRLQRIPNPYHLPAGLSLLIPDPAFVHLD